MASVPRGSGYGDRVTSRFSVLFDLDGTLVDSEPYAIEVGRLYAREFGIAEENDLPPGSSDEDHFSLMSAATGIDRQELYWGYWDRLRGVLREKLQPVEATYRLAVGLRAAGVPIAIVSNSRRHRILETLEIAAPLLVGCPVVGSDDVVRPKPAPDPYLRGAELLGVRPEDCVVVEDTLLGATAARAAGMEVMRLAALEHAS